MDLNTLRSLLRPDPKTGGLALDLSRRSLTVLPESIGQLSGLTKLDLSGNKLTELPESIGQLSGLTELDLRWNKFTELPESIGQLSGLTKLNLQWNKLTELPESIGQLGGLTVLDLSGNKLTDLPESIGQLGGLTVLDLGGNKLTELPESIGQLSGLTKLYLIGNRLSELPESIGQLSGLTKLDLGGNRLTELPESIGRLRNLTKLDLSLTLITHVPRQLWEGSKRNVTLFPSETLQSPPCLVAKDGARAVRRWFRQQDRLDRKVVLANDIQRANANKPSVLACVETLLAVVALVLLVKHPEAWQGMHRNMGWLARNVPLLVRHYFIFYTLIGFALLLRTPESQQLGLDWFTSLFNELRIRGSWGLGYLFLPAKILLLGLGSIAIRFAAVLATLLRHPWQSILAIPGNWRRVVFCLDTACAPEFVSGMEKRSQQNVNNSMSIREFWGDFTLVHGLYWSGIGAFRRLTLLPISLILLPFYVLPFVYRFSLKSTCLVYFPFVFITQPHHRDEQRVTELVRTLAQGLTERFRLFLAFIYAAGYGFFAYCLLQMQDMLQAANTAFTGMTGMLAALYCFWIPDLKITFGVWHLSRIATAMLTIFLALYVNKQFTSEAYQQGFPDPEDAAASGTDKPLGPRVHKHIVNLLFARACFATFTLFCGYILFLKAIRFGPLISLLKMLRLDMPSF